MELDAWSVMHASPPSHALEHACPPGPCLRRWTAKSLHLMRRQRIQADQRGSGSSLLGPATCASPGRATAAKRQVGLRGESSAGSHGMNIMGIAADAHRQNKTL